MDSPNLTSQPTQVTYNDRSIQPEETLVSLFPPTLLPPGAPTSEVLHADWPAVTFDGDHRADLKRREDEMPNRPFFLFGQHEGMQRRYHIWLHWYGLVLYEL